MSGKWPTDPMPPVRFATHEPGFQVRVEEEWSSADQCNKYLVLTTQNGYQWSGGHALTLRELRLVHEFIGGLIEGIEE